MARQRIYFDISQTLLKKLIICAASRGSKKSTWTKEVITELIETSYPQAQNWIKQEADAIGISQQELEQKILAREGFDLETYQQELLGGSDD